MPSGLLSWRSALCATTFVAAQLVAAGSTFAADCSGKPAAGVDWQDCDKRVLILSGSTFDKANLQNVNFSGTDLRETTLAAANLEKANLVRASLADATAKGANFSRIEAYRTDFSRLDGEGAQFVNAELQRSLFEEAKLKGADFTKAELGRAEFKGADISGAKFDFANLARADLRGAKFETPISLDRAFLYVTRLEGLDLSQVASLQQWQIELSCGDDKTVLPAGLTAPASWPCTFEHD